MQWKDVSSVLKINHCKQQRELELPNIDVKLKEKRKEDPLLHEDEQQNPSNWPSSSYRKMLCLFPWANWIMMFPVPWKKINFN